MTARWKVLTVGVAIYAVYVTHKLLALTDFVFRWTWESQYPSKNEALPGDAAFGKSLRDVTWTEADYADVRVAMWIVIVAVVIAIGVDIAMVIAKGRAGRATSR